MKSKTKSNIAIGAGSILLVIALIFGCGLWSKKQSATPPTPASYDEDGFPDIDWDYWLGINADIVGWVTVPDTNINHPIVQAQPEDPRFYLKHDIYRQWNPYGAVYLDAACIEAGLLSENSIIYGHHMNDDTMFSAFANFSDTTYAQEHSSILLQTPDWKKKVDVQCVEVAAGWAATKKTSFVDTVDFSDWYQGRFDASCVQLATGDASTHDSPLYTFCTCSYNYFSDERTLVYATEGILNEQ